MSRCDVCGNELLTGDIHWEIGLCNKCYYHWLNDETGFAFPENQ